jgi:hypothetical protein
VVFGVSIVDRRFDDFDSKNTIWRLSLATDQARSLRSRSSGWGAPTRTCAPTTRTWETSGPCTRCASPDGRRRTPLVASTTRALLFRMSSTQGQVEMTFPVASSAGFRLAPAPTAPALPPSRPRRGDPASEPARQYTRSRSTPQPPPARKKAHSVFVPSGWRPAPCRPGGRGTAASASGACSTT